MFFNMIRLMSSIIRILDIDYLTRSVNPVKLLGTHIFPKGNPLTTSQMFFRPYKSTEEFEYCAVHTLIPLMSIGLAMMVPYFMMAATIIAVGSSVASAVLGGINKLYGNEQSGSFYLDTAEDITKGLCNLIINILVTPLSLMIMLTRGIATGLQAAGFNVEHNIAGPSFG